MLVLLSPWLFYYLATKERIARTIFYFSDSNLPDIEKDSRVIHLDGEEPSLPSRSAMSHAQGIVPSRRSEIYILVKLPLRFRLRIGARANISIWPSAEQVPEDQGFAQISRGTPLSSSLPSGVGQMIS